MKFSNFIIVSIFAVWLAGCNLLEWPVYVIFGQRHEKIKAEYTGLNGHKTAIVVATGPGVDFEYPEAKLNVALATAVTVRGEINDVEFVEQEKVERFQMVNLDWPAMSMSEIAKQLNVDRILYIDLYQFTLYEQRSVQLLRGRVRATLQIYETDSPFPNRVVYQSEIATLYPEHGPVPSSPAAMHKLQTETIIIFAQTLARKFYDHKVNVKQ